MNKKIISFVCFILMITLCIIPTTGEFTVTNTKNSTIINIILDELDTYIINEMNVNRIPGLSALIEKEGRIVWTGHYGYANISKNQLVEDSTLFMLASISKTITGVALMQLYEKNLFMLNDPINNYLSFKVYNPDNKNTEITFHMLLTHTSSIRDSWGAAMSTSKGDYPVQLGEYLKSYLTPNGSYYDSVNNFYTCKPGTEYHYSNVAVALVGYLVEVLSGMSFEEYCQKNIFKPLNMNDTSWFLANLNISHIAIPYNTQGFNFRSIGHYGCGFYPSSQLRTSSLQLRNFLSMLLNDGKFHSTILLNKSTIELMTTPRIPQISYNIGYIFALGPSYFWHNGAWGGIRTMMRGYKDTKTGIIILTNGESDVVFSGMLSAIYSYACRLPFVNTPPEIPDVPRGSLIGKSNVLYNFSSSTVDFNDDQIYYFWDWGDGQNSGWVGSYYSGQTIILQHDWTEVGNYNIKIKAKDIYNEESNWSDSFIVTIRQEDNNPPNKPAAPIGDKLGKIGIYYTYISSTMDIDGDQIYYLFDWNDGTTSGWLGPYTSGATINITHKWTVEGSFNIRVKARDMFGAESPWSDPLPITMPYTMKPPFQQFLEGLFQRFPNAFPILRQLMGY